ncbi:MAG TPA: trehalase [Flavobacteriales bacterium]|nr:trehalase [Flavobacteriales bacterium]
MNEFLKCAQRINHKSIYLILYSGILLLSTSCNEQPPSDSGLIYYPSNSLDYAGSPDSSKDRSILAFSDLGAWFAYGLPTEASNYGGFTGPFLLTQENGVWSSKALSKLELINIDAGKPIDWGDFEVTQTSYNSHLNQVFANEHLKVSQTLVFSSAHSALIITDITNLSDNTFNFFPTWKGSTFLAGTKLEQQGDAINLISNKSSAKGIIQVFGHEINKIAVGDNAYAFTLENFELKGGKTKQLILSHSFIFPEYSFKDEQLHLKTAASKVGDLLQRRIKGKQAQLEKLYDKLDTTWNDSPYKDLVAKAVLTLQNNWRIPAGQLNHSGVFPSYHYIWFHGFWAWDSWKHAVALAQYDTPLAKEQIKAMYAYLTEDGFIPDCIYRDTIIEKHNYRNTKPPLSAWSVWKVYEKSRDIHFLKELYPKIIRQHNWWYMNRDHDKDGICEYGSTDGSLVAAKWESGMDNAVRFDNSKILKTSETAYSLNQESVDLNCYLYAEKIYLMRMAKILELKEDADTFSTQSEILKTKIQSQFFDPETGWFYDTSLDGKKFVVVMGCEGWIPLWASVASAEQAEAVKSNMMNPEYFNTKVPLQTLSASSPGFKPDGGYWRGPTWLDQAYFGVAGLHNYGYHEDAYNATYKLIHNAVGVLSEGISIRENYQPITGEGLESENFSWSAAHYLLLLLDE